jgi:hypothetical protein
VRRDTGKSVASLMVLIVVGVWTLVLVSQPAFAACEPSTSNAHTVGSVYHGNRQTYCLPAGTFNYTVWTNHGHGNKYVALWHTGSTHLHCDVLAGGSNNAQCSTSGINGHHHSYHDIAGLSSVDRFPDGHGFDSHSMEDSA